MSAEYRRDDEYRRDEYMPKDNREPDGSSQDDMDCFAPPDGLVVFRDGLHLDGSGTCAGDYFDPTTFADGSPARLPRLVLTDYLVLDDYSGVCPLVRIPGCQGPIRQFGNRVLSGLIDGLCNLGLRVSGLHSRFSALHSRWKRFVSRHEPEVYCLGLLAFQIGMIAIAVRASMP